MISKEKEWFIEVPWGKISVLVWGDCCNPPVLLVHGNRDTATTFRPLVSLLPDNFYYVAIELPGCGKSDWFPPGMMINRLYDLAYPGLVTKLIELDPVLGVIVIPPSLFPLWYHNRFTSYYEQYDKYNSPRETAPKYTRQQAIQSLMQNTTGLTQEAAEARIERMIEPVGDNLVRFTFDNRYKKITMSPFSLEYLKKVFTAPTTPLLTIVSDVSVQKDQYMNAEFALDEGSYPARNCKVRRVPGNHDAHYQEPETMAPFIAQFLLYGLDGIQSKAKL